jgi:hypothetical protein
VLTATGDAWNVDLAALETQLWRLVLLVRRQGGDGVSTPHFSNNSDGLDLRRSTAQRSVLDARVRDLILLYARTVLINEGTGDAPTTSTATSSRGRQSIGGSTTAAAAAAATASAGGGAQQQPRSSSSGVNSSTVSGGGSRRTELKTEPKAAVTTEDSYTSELFSSERYATLQLQELMADSSDEHYHHSGELLSRQRSTSADQHSDDSLEQQQPHTTAAAAAAAATADEQQSECGSEEDAYESDFNGSEDNEFDDDNDKAVAKAAAAGNNMSSSSRTAAAQRCADSTDAEDCRAESIAVHDSDNTGIADSAADSSSAVADGDSKHSTA